MNKDDFKKITASFILEGYFSEYLPHSFSLEENENIANLFDGSIPMSQKNDFAEPIVFSMSRFKQDESRRNIYIPELCSYIKTMKTLSDKDIIRDLITTLNSGVSFSPLLQASGELTRHEQAYSFRVSKDGIDREDEFSYIPSVIKKITRAKGAKKILYLDISNFYSSIYTHLVPAIKLGYEEASVQFKKYNANKQDSSVSNDYKNYMELDQAIRDMNGARTNGILPGTMVSQFIAEALLSRIDKELQNENINYVRYVDDYEVFIYNENDISKTKKIIESVLKKYFLTLNEEKTRIVDFPYYVVENLQKVYLESIGRELDDVELMTLFNSYFVFEKNGIKGAIRFLIKSIDNSLLPKNKELFTTYLINTLVNDNRSLTRVCELLIIQSHNTVISRQDKNIIKNLLIKHVDCGDDLEVIWLLYLFKKIRGGRLPNQILEKIFDSENDLAKIVLIEEYKLTSSNIKRCKDNATSWILCYQLFLRNYLTKDEFSKKSGIKNNTAFYAKLKKKNFSFYHK